ncbi:LysR family transcriptional regulator [Actinacidiphila sp. ITFR-21]|uniref:LysR family transcriptional regulator n=1 Tax=Actinacidiphila sp. ITFR-21 TaxID=3075199 RepID=UPI00288AEB88|nr:LysR family transcriptional regulator [Streptomyces sp. ITFR-21]WNI16720.1 LysR family transcriptional regulator [Streptomyces sp. ITFR-21]
MLLPDMNLLPALDALLREGSVTGAAAVMNVSPSAMSRTLARLRRVVGDPLLVPSGRGLVLTARARELRPQAEAALIQALAALRPPPPVDIAEVSREFALRTNDGVAVVLGSALTAHVAREAPRIRLRILPEGEEDPADLRDRVDLDLSAFHELPADVHSAFLYQDTSVAVLRSGGRPSAAGAGAHPPQRPPAGPRRPGPGETGPLAPPEPPGPADPPEPLGVERFAAVPHITVSRRGRIHGVVDDRLAELGLRRHVLATVPTFSAACFLALESDALAIVPAVFAARIAGVMGLTVHPIPLRLPPVTLDMAWHVRHDTDPAHRWLREAVLRITREVRGAGPPRDGRGAGAGVPDGAG